MNASTRIFAALAAALVGVAVILIFVPRETVHAPEVSGEAAALAPYFMEQMIARGIADVGQPIEGFDASLLLMAYPGLTVSDFDEVAAREGEYVAAGTRLEFTRNNVMQVSSAERAIAEAGYRTLLHNVTNRLKTTLTSEADVDALIDTIDTRERVRAVLNASASALNVTIIPREVLEDSRCPVDVTCIQEGTVRVRTTIESGLGASTMDFEVGEPITTEAETITLMSVSPVPKSTVTIEPQDYLFTFDITKRNGENQ